MIKCSQSHTHILKKSQSFKHTKQYHIHSENLVIILAYSNILMITYMLKIVTNSYKNAQILTKFLVKYDNFTNPVRYLAVIRIQSQQTRNPCDV